MKEEIDKSLEDDKAIRIVNNSLVVYEIYLINLLDERRCARNEEIDG